VTLGAETPSVQDGKTTADVAQRDGQIDRFVGHFGEAVPAGHLHPVVIHEADLLPRVLPPGGMSTGRNSTNNGCSAARAALFSERTEAKVATANTSTPTAVAREEIVAQPVTLANIRRHLYWLAWIQAPCARAVDVWVVHLRAGRVAPSWSQQAPTDMQDFGP
jgi:hypothetical protein